MLLGNPSCFSQSKASPELQMHAAQVGGFLSLPGIRTVASSSIQGMERESDGPEQKGLFCLPPSLLLIRVCTDSQIFCWLSVLGRKGQQHSVARAIEV